MAGSAVLKGTPGGFGPAEPEGARGWPCSEHSDRVVELFCRRCRRCVCALCPVLGSHRGHPIGLALDEAARVQKFTQECLKHLATKKQQEVGNITQIEDAAEKLKAHAESSKTWLTGKFTELRLLLEEEEALAKKFIDKNTQLALQAYTEQIKSCGEQIDVMNTLSNRVWTISQETNPVQLLQVLSRDCFAAGRHYWEVDVQEAGVGWWVGAAYGSLRRHGASDAARLGCNRQSWCLKRYDLEYWAFHDCQRSRLRPRHDPDRLGVFLDYEAGVLAFYDVTDGMSHLHTFRAAFQEPLYPALRLWEGAISISRLP